MPRSPSRDRHPSLLGRWPAVAALAAVSLGCDDRTPEEKGRDYAKEKLGFAQGAVDTLKEKGGELGKSTGQGVGDLVKGVGSGVKDSATPSVEITVSPGASEAGVLVHQANEGGSDGDRRLLLVYAEFQKPFHGQLELFARGAQGEELGRGELAAPLDFTAAKKEQLSFRFPAQVRFSHAKKYLLEYRAPVELAVAPSLAALHASQLKQRGATVTVYVRFEAAWKGQLELRAYGGDGSELGRSKKTAQLRQESDSAGFFDFEFDPRAPLDQATRFELR